MITPIEGNRYYEKNGTHENNCKSSISCGGKRVGWNVLMAIAAGLAAFGSVWTLWSKLQWIGIGVMGAFTGLVLIVQICRKPNKQKM